MGRPDLAIPPKHARTRPAAMSTLEKLIEQHQLMRHPEGGWYREMHRSTTQVERSDAAKRPGLTAILFLLPKEEISCWHRVSGADEAWIHIDGADLNLFQCTPDGSGLQEIVLNGENPLHVVPAGWWQAAQSNGSHTLVSCCVGPGFDFADFEMLRQQLESKRPVLPHPELI